MTTSSPTRADLEAALWRARDRMDRARSDAEFEACRQVEIAARAALEDYDWKHWRRAA